MQEFAERNACSPDLWRHLQTTSHLPVTEIMESWILQSGYPCVAASLETLNGLAYLKLAQERFYANPQAKRDNRQLWRIPMVIRYGDEAGTHELRHVLPDPTETFMLPVEGDLHWCILNADQIGFYRQKLSGPLLNKLLSHLDQLTPSEQMGLLGDQWALTRRGDQSISLFLDVLMAMALQTENHNLLSVIVGHLHTLEKQVEDLENSLALDQFRRWVGSLFQKQLKALGYEPGQNEPVEVSQRRVSLMDALATLAHDPQVIAQAGILAEREMIDPQSVDPNLADLVIAIRAQFGDETLFGKYVDIYQARKATSAPPQLVNRYLYSFPAFRTPGLVAQTLSLLDEGIAPKEAWGPLLHKMFSLHHARVAAWQHLKKNWTGIKELDFWAGELIKAGSELPYHMRSDYVEFCEANVKGVFDMGYAQGLEDMELRAESQARTKDELTSWLGNSTK
jgi:aminopeptidase N/puromycin-sensitive aminopeptidase